MRYNIFNQIHKGLRALLYDTSLTIQQTDFANAAEAEETLKKVQQVIDMFDNHAHHEDHFILPAVKNNNPGLADAFEQEHEEDHALGQRLRGLMSAYQHAVSTSEKIQTGYSLQVAFVEFLVFNLKHMAREEDVLNTALWKQYDDAQLLGLNKTIVSNIPPDEQAFASTWMMKGLNNQEIVVWLKQVRSNAPEPVFTALFNMAAAELPQQRWRQVQEVLMEGVQAA